MKIIIANILNVIASCLFTGSNFTTTKKRMLFVQIVEIVLGIIACFLVSSYAGIFSLFIALVRTLLVYFDIDKKYVISIISILVIISLIKTPLGILWVPYLASMQLTLSYALADDIQWLRFHNFINVLLWAIYDIRFNLYTNLVISIILGVNLIINYVRFNKAIQKS